MTYRHFLAATLGPVSALALMACATGALPGAAEAAGAPAAQSSKPNIVFILMDDLGWRDVGYAGSTFYETPAIDQLAKDGMRFENAYVAYPRCTPSRFALMTGKNPAREGIPGGTAGESMAPSEFTMAEALHEGGYHTFFAGKWHLGKVPAAMPDAQGFDINIGGGSAGAVGSHFFPYGAEKGRTLGPGLEQGKPGEYLTDRLTDETIKFIEDHRKTNPGQPFFAYLSHYAVHTPLEAKPELKAKFAKKLAAMGGAKTDAYLQRDGQTKKYQDNVTYAAMIASMDESVGRIRAALNRLGVADNTIIVFTSDHGGLSNRAAGGGRDVATSNLPLRAGKGHNYEGGIKVPLIVYWPGKTKGGTVSREVTINTDHFPSLLAAAGLPLRPQSHLDGLSYLPLLTGGKMPADRVSYWYSPRPRPNQTGDTSSAAIRQGNWKYFQSYDSSVPSQLFDLSKNPNEDRDLSSANPGKMAEMKKMLDGWLASIKAVAPRMDRDGGEGMSDKKKKKRDARRAERKAAKKAGRSDEE